MRHLLLLASAAAMVVTGVTAAGSAVYFRQSPHAFQPTAACTIRSMSEEIMPVYGVAMNERFVVTQPNRVPLGYSLEGDLPAGLRFDARIPAIVGTPTEIGAFGPFRVVVDSRNGVPGNYCQTDAFEIAIEAPTIDMSFTPPAAKACRFFEAGVGTDGTPPLSFTVSPALPEFLAIDAQTGLVSGTPRQGGSYGPFTIVAGDARGGKGEAQFSLAVGAADPLAVVLTPSATSVTAGTPFTLATSVSGGTGRFSYSITPDLPAGLSFNASTGAISGAPTAAGNYGPFTVRASDTGCVTSGSATFSLTVVPAVTLDSNLMSWGYAATGALGYAAASDQVRPRDVSGVPKLKEVSMGNDHACGITAAGSAWCWGSNANGQFGTGNTTSSVTPVAAAPGRSFRQITAGDRLTCGIDTSGKLWCWGLGQGSSPVAVMPTDNFLVVESRLGTTCVGRSPSGMFCWGDDMDGKLGNGSPAQSSSTPVAVLGMANETISKIGIGLNFACAMNSYGNIKCWGYGYQGQMGNGSNANQWTPVYAMSADDDYYGYTGSWKDLSVANNHVCAVSKRDNAYCWGSNYSGQLGTGYPGGTANRPALVDTRWSGQFSRIYAGDAVTCGTTLWGNQAWCWGGNLRGTVGVGGSTSNRWSPESVGRSFTSMSLNQAVAFGLK